MDTAEAHALGVGDDVLSGELPPELPPDNSRGPVTSL